jgi:hypothetical protein
MIGVNGGAIELPELKVPWWNIDAGEWRIATLPARTITVKAAEEPVFVQPVTATTPEVDVTEAVDFKLMPAGFWERVSQLLAAAWLLTIFAWWWSSRDRKREPRAPEPPPIYKQQAKLVKTARKAALAGNDAALRVAMLEWGRLQWPDNAPRSVGALAERVSSPLADELNRLSRASYGRGASDWDGAALAKALRSIVVLREHAEAGHHEALPPLMPPAV